MHIRWVSLSVAVVAVLLGCPSTRAQVVMLPGTGPAGGTATSVSTPPQPSPATSGVSPPRLTLSERQPSAPAEYLAPPQPPHPELLPSAGPPPLQVVPICA